MVFRSYTNNLEQYGVLNFKAIFEFSAKFTIEYIYHFFPKGVDNFETEICG